jgi:hypothetical protein
VIRFFFVETIAITATVLGSVRAAADGFLWPVDDFLPWLAEDRRNDGAGSPQGFRESSHPNGCTAKNGDCHHDGTAIAE